MFLGPIVNDELIGIARQKRWYVLRTLLGLGLPWFIWISYASSMFVYRSSGVIDSYSYAELRLIAMRIFASLAFCQGIVILLLTPMLTAGAIADEKQRKTLHYLLAS